MDASRRLAVTGPRTGLAYTVAVVGTVAVTTVLLCRGIARAHGGGLWVETTPGGGSAFVLSLPAAAQAAVG